MATTILRLPAVMARTGLARSTIYLLMREKKQPFPKPIKLGSRAVGWIASDIETWLACRIEYSRGSSSPNCVAA